MCWVWQQLGSVPTKTVMKSTRASEKSQAIASYSHFKKALHIVSSVLFLFKISHSLTNSFLKQFCIRFI